MSLMLEKEKYWLWVLSIICMHVDWTSISCLIFAIMACDWSSIDDDNYLVYPATIPVAMIKVLQVLYVHDVQTTTSWCKQIICFDTSLYVELADLSVLMTGLSSFFHCRNIHSYAEDCVNVAYIHNIQSYAEDCVMWHACIIIFLIFANWGPWEWWTVQRLPVHWFRCHGFVLIRNLQWHTALQFWSCVQWVFVLAFFSRTY
jgi:hypothetical protein